MCVISGLVLWYFYRFLAVNLLIKMMLVLDILPEKHCNKIKNAHNLNFLLSWLYPTEAYVGILERHMRPSTRQLFPGTPCLFQQNNARPHSARVTTAWLRRLRVLDWAACSLALSPIENVLPHYEKENQTIASTDCWAAQVLYTPRMGNYWNWKTATIDIFSSQMIAKCH